jgi:hypothetical protein
MVSLSFYQVLLFLPTLPDKSEPSKFNSGMPDEGDALTGIARLDMLGNSDLGYGGSFIPLS